MSLSLYIVLSEITSAVRGEIVLHYRHLHTYIKTWGGIRSTSHWAPLNSTGVWWMNLRNGCGTVWSECPILAYCSSRRREESQRPLGLIKNGSIDSPGCRLARSLAAPAGDGGVLREMAKDRRFNTSAHLKCMMMANGTPLEPWTRGVTTVSMAIPPRDSCIFN